MVLQKKESGSGKKKVELYFTFTSCRGSEFLEKDKNFHRYVPSKVE